MLEVCPGETVRSGRVVAVADVQAALGSVRTAGKDKHIVLEVAFEVEVEVGVVVELRGLEVAVVVAVALFEQPAAIVPMLPNWLAVVELGLVLEQEQELQLEPEHKLPGLHMELLLPEAVPVVVRTPLLAVVSSNTAVASLRC
jgi:hypothetical protein